MLELELEITVGSIYFQPPYPQKWKNWVILGVNHFPLETCRALICSHMGPLWGPIFPPYLALPNSQAAGLAQVPLGPHENPDPAKKVGSKCTLTAERCDPGPAPMDSGRKVRSNMFPGHLAQFYA